ncbi:MAG: bifunctional aldolase/short-chain dehydrogenase [Caulobacteraceae bacterium]|nr:bifunctional aldolase/short-chain dehydrogenase [Caulobacteraceae bacterium]
MSGWSEGDARAALERWAASGEDIALRTYSARLLGADRRLVLHGGGNTSVKTTVVDLFGDTLDVLCVKGSGSDLAAIEPAGHPAVRLAPLLRLRGLQRLSDEAMVGALRQNLIDPSAPNPSVEALLHAFIPEKFIDHTHSVAVLALANQPDAEALIGRLYGGRVACVPYVMPGFALAKAAAAAFDDHPGIEGLILINHGVFSFGATAQESYERMIGLVATAEAHLGTASPTPPSESGPLAPADEALPILRGVMAQLAAEAHPRHWLLDLRRDAQSLAFAADDRLADWARRGVATPDHVIRTKAAPLVAPAYPGDAGAAVWREEVLGLARDFATDYQAYFARQNTRVGGMKRALDPLPRVIVAPGLGLVGVGRSARDASVAADIAQSWHSTLRLAEGAGRFQPVGEDDTFDMEYWSLEQAKIGKAPERPLQGRIVIVTGGGGAIGRATAAAFRAEGAQVAIFDLDEDAAERAARELGAGVLALRCDVTSQAAVESAFAAVCSRFGGLDIVVSNAGRAVTGRIAEIDQATIQGSLDVNFLAHQWVASAAMRVMRAQAMGGVLLFNASKQALNPGEGFGAYGVAKAALVALMRQYALEHGADGVRVNAINADRIRSGLLGPEMIAKRAAARGVSEADYMAGNLLRREVTAEDVAQAFVFAAQMRSTTGSLLTVDGGNVAAMVR